MRLETITYLTHWTSICRLGIVGIAQRRDTRVNYRSTSVSRRVYVKMHSRWLKHEGWPDRVVSLDKSVLVVQACFWKRPHCTDLGTQVWVAVLRVNGGLAFCLQWHSNLTLRQVAGIGNDHSKQCTKLITHTNAQRIGNLPVQNAQKNKNTERSTHTSRKTRTSSYA